jgi:hypothetical protein
VLPDEPQLITELARIRSKYRAGAAAAETPRAGDSHCDVAVAVALGVRELDWSARSGDDWKPREPDPANRQVTAGIMEKVF